MYLNTFDHFAKRLVDKDANIHCINRYVDDIVCIGTKDQDVTATIAALAGSTPELTFTSEISDGTLQFLDLRLLTGAGLCWMYGKAEPKPPLNGRSCHSKNAKAAVRSTLLSNAVNKSCGHKRMQAAGEQMRRLLAAGYSRTQVRRAVMCLLKDKPRKEDKHEPGERFRAMPYIHDWSHSVKKLAKKHGVVVGLSIPHKLANMCRFTISSTRTDCGIKHPTGSSFVQCRRNGLPDPSLVWRGLHWPDGPVSKPATSTTSNERV